MRLTDFCNRLPSRAPCGSLDSRLFLAVPRCLASRRCSVSRPGTGSPWASPRDGEAGEPAARLPNEPNQVELRLTANLQLRPVPQPARDTRRPPEGAPEPGPRTFTCAVERGPGGAPIDGSSTLHLSTAAFSTARRACDPTSDVPCHDPRRIDIAADPLSLRAARPGFARRLVKDEGFDRAGTPSIDECSLPRARPALARLARGITRSPPPVSLHACSWLSPPRPGFRRHFTR